MDFVDNAGTRYQLTEAVEAPAPAKKSVWPWVVGGLALAGGLVWMASASSRKSNPISDEQEALLAKARDPETPHEHLEHLFKRGESEVRLAILENPNLCPVQASGLLDTYLLSELASEFPEEVAAHPLFALHVLIEPSDEMRGVVYNVVNKTKDVGTMERLLSWGADLEWVREAVASNPHLPVHLLRQLGDEETEPSAWVRQAVASNPNTQIDLLHSLANEQTESDVNVRVMVAKNPRTPEDLLRSMGNLKTESEWSMREAVAQNPNTPLDVIRTLANKKTESDTDVRNAAQKALAKRGLA